MSSVLQDCPVCKKSYTHERRRTINLHTDIPMCLDCDRDYCQAQDNYRKWGFKIGKLVKWSPV